MNKFSNAHRNARLYFQKKLPIIVEMINGLGIGANEGGQQPSEMSYSANWETPCARALPMAKFSRKRLTKRPGITTSLTETASQTESDVSYRKQRADYFLTETRTAQCGARLFVAPQRMILGPRRGRQAVTEVSREVVECVALPQGDIQSLCGTITIWGTVRSHGTAGIV
jgi:hypothetical protein